MLMPGGEGCPRYLSLTGEFIMPPWAPAGWFGGRADSESDIGMTSLYVTAPLKLCSLLLCLQHIWVLWFFLM